MNSDQTYNGWTNYETWLVKLWQDNAEGSQSFFGEMARHCFDNAKPDDFFSQSERATLDLSDTLKEYYENEAQDKFEAVNGSVWADLLNGALSAVNWHEIAKRLVEELETVNA